MCVRGSAESAECMQVGSSAPLTTDLTRRKQAKKRSAWGQSHVCALCTRTQYIAHTRVRKDNKPEPASGTQNTEKKSRRTRVAAHGTERRGKRPERTRRRERWWKHHEKKRSSRTLERDALALHLFCALVSRNAGAMAPSLLDPHATAVCL